MSIGQYREEIDLIDKEILKLFQIRMDTVKKVAEYKIANNIPVLNSQRESEILKDKAKSARPEYSNYVIDLFEKLMEISRDMQNNIIENNK